VITSLLRLQSDSIRDPQTLKLFDEMYGRVRSIAAIHELLYRSDNLARLEFGTYLQKITRDLIAFYKVDTQKIKVRSNIHSAFLDITQAVPCGLIVNELVTNCLKHAFVDGRPGLIQASLETKGDRIVLTVADNGVGLPKDLDPYQPASMGLQLVNLLVDQIEGTLAIDRNQGTRVSIMFAGGSSREDQRK
jgi:two-component sensor histidine kinase